MRFHVTERGSFKRCPRQAHLTSSNGLHLTKMFGLLALSTGSLYHRAHQLWLNGTAAGDSRNLYEWGMEASLEEQEKTRERYKRQVGMYPTPKQMETLDESIDFALSMCEHYQTKYGTPFMDGYRFIAAEQKISIPVPGTEHMCMFCLGMGFTQTKVGPRVCEDCQWVSPGVSRHKLEGKMDALFQDERTGRLDPVERKSFNTRPKEDALSKNDQFIAYPFMVKALKLDADPHSCVIYDGQWRRHEVPARKTFDDLFLRVVLPERSKAECAEFERFLPIELNKMYALYRAPVKEAYTNRRWQGCWDCGMEELCWAITRGEGTDVLLREKYTTRSDDVEDAE